ncbi:thermonuclease family protein [Hydrogenophaga sp. SL48]|uniref:thermonuclease family protein n=1 Tax=Hydrogenophaga sp. SL48 TaxID=2806347 RepID=UPI003FA57DF1|nr:thermonuclease family protein [Hydrogenophaga sp. SL48]
MSEVLASEPAGVQTCVEVRNVHDGDTFTCVTEAGTLRIRVAGIDAPEVGQSYWRVSRDLLRSNTPAGSTVDCYKVDRYERQVCRVHTPEGKDVAMGLVEAGLAWHTVKYREEQAPHEQAAYAAAEERARNTRKGLLTLSEPQEPSVCREQRKQKLKCT